MGCCVGSGQALNGGRFGKNRVYQAVYKNNCEVFARWAFPQTNGTERNLGDRTAFLNGTRVYAKDFSVADLPSPGYETKLGCVNRDCIDLAAEMVKNGYKPAILNLASRFCAGGGYADGTKAQEESLCRASTLSQSLYQYFDPRRKFVRDAGVPPKFNAIPSI